MTNRKGIVLLSGGLDSLTVLAHAQSLGFNMHAVTINYGQKHVYELKAAQKIAEHYQVPHQVISIPAIGQFDSALTQQDQNIPKYKESDAIPSTYVPARNLIFLSLATGLAESIGAGSIWIGASAVDYSGYPDCRPEFFRSLQQTIDLGTKQGAEGHHLVVKAPLIDLSKAQTIQMGVALGVDYALSVSCYQTDAQGLACGQCDSCVLRQRGFQNAHVEDPTRYRQPAEALSSRG